MSKLIPLSGKIGAGKFAVVDDDQYEELSKWRWHIVGGGYAARKVVTDGKHIRIRMHHLVLPPKPGFFSDHINNIRLDNRRRNLRHATPSENTYNTVIRSDNTSGYKGVTHFAGRDEWVAQISYKGKQSAIGYFKTKEEAAIAYNLKALEVHGEFANINDPKTIPGYELLLPVVAARLASDLPPANTSGRRGVSWYLKTSKWKTQVL